MKLGCRRCGGWGEWLELPGKRVTCDLCNGSGAEPDKENEAVTDHITRRNPEMEKYVKIQPVITEDGEQFVLLLQIENQQFHVGQFPEETLKGAEWSRDMLCIALARLVAGHQ